MIPPSNPLSLPPPLLGSALRIGIVHARWNTRIIFIPGATPVTNGPYRFVRHPNYVAVILEMVCIPLVHGAWFTAAFFTVANAVLLTVRIRAEEAALGAESAPEYDEQAAGAIRALRRIDQSLFGLAGDLHLAVAQSSEHGGSNQVEEYNGSSVTDSLYGRQRS